MLRHLSLVGRYTFLSMVVVLGAMLALGVLYDRFANELLDRLTGERLSAQVSATANRLNAFIETRLYQLETLSNHPGLPLFRDDPSSPAAAEVAAVLYLEADLPDLYGILFFDDHGALGRVVAGQAASGPPYWSVQDWNIEDLPNVTYVDTVEVIGPRLPADGSAGWILLRQPIRGGTDGSQSSVGLHVRLASLTELLSGAGVAGVVRVLLRTPQGVVLDATGRPVVDPGTYIDGPDILPGWKIVLDLHPGAILEPLTEARNWLYGAGVFIAGLIIAIFYALSRSLRRRVETLVQGANSLASGDLQYRLPEGRSDDEITAVGRAFNTMAERLRLVIARMVQTEKMAVLGEFATGVAHEVRNPLATMKTTVQALGRQEPDPERRELLDDMEFEIDRLGRVVDDLLTYGRPSPPALRRVPVRELFRRVTGVLGPLAEDRGVRLVSLGDSRLDVHADSDHTQQVLVNLGLNAVQACDNGGTVTFRAHAVGNKVEIRVKDDGCGIPPNALSDVSEPFFTTKSKGTGLGLTISRQMIEANHGSLGIESIEGEGTMVTVLLPAAQSEAPAKRR